MLAILAAKGSAAVKFSLRWRVNETENHAQQPGIWGMSG
jgi:hypothetical protein